MEKDCVLNTVSKHNHKQIMVLANSGQVKKDSHSARETTCDKLQERMKGGKKCRRQVLMKQYISLAGTHCSFHIYTCIDMG